MSYKFHITDVFTNNVYSGNQLATIILEEDIPQETMLAITREFNFSETTFVLQPEYGNATFKTRIFTPSGEVPFAGHPTLGTAWLMHKYYNRNAKIINLELPIGIIPVEVTGYILWMTQQPAEFSTVVKREEICQLINIAPEGIRSDLPVETVSTGFPTILIPIVSIKTLREAYTTIKQYRDFFAHKSPATLYLFTEETCQAEHTFSARAFCDMLGITEDPATGSAAGCLGAYLHKHLQKDITATIEQGYEINRRSLIELHVTPKSLRVGGSVTPVAHGELN